ncbi:hypothetical protein K438DRAFT_630509 [Mycena galopus ATCC 62051]|nr:hypothetical protein K438DRAFT_630509 [Mycena galopus ATCC 62051]
MWLPVTMSYCHGTFSNCHILLRGVLHEQMEVDGQPLAEIFRKQNVKLRKLGRVVRELLASDPGNTRRVLQARGIEDLDTFLSSSEADSEAVWDDADCVYRCPECVWELEHGECERCEIAFEIDPRDDGDYTRNEALNADRLLEPRGDTPLRDDDQHPLPPSVYMGRRDEYDELRRRGATRFMCETFNLEFDAATGIVAWADGDTYREFAGPLMQVGDFWKIMLGRRIQLDEDDPDGSLFIEAVLEDALLFPLWSGQKWETVEDEGSPGIWITRPVDPTDSETTDSEVSDEDAKLEPGYVAPALPVQTQNYETSDAESDVDMTMDDPSIKREQEDDELLIEEDTEEDDDPGWAFDPNIPDTCWAPSDAPEPEANVDVQAADEGSLSEDAAEDSADSDFDSDEVLSGDEGVLAAGQRYIAYYGTSA